MKFKDLLTEMGWTVTPTSVTFDRQDRKTDALSANPGKFNNLSFVNGKMAISDAGKPFKKTVDDIGTVVYSVWQYESKNEDHEAIRDAIKGKGNRSISSAELDDMLDLAAMYMKKKISKISKPDLIIKAPSKYSLVDRWQNSLSSYFGEVPVLLDAFIKKYAADVKIDVDRVRDSQKQKIASEIQASLDRMKRNDDPFSMSGIFNRYRQYVYDFMYFDEELSSRITGKKIMILDEFMTTGSTTKEMARLLQPLNPSAVYGAVLMSQE